MKVKEFFRRSLACLLIAAMMPQQTIAFAAEQATSLKNKKEDVLVRWIPSDSVIEPGEKGTVKLEARINKKTVEHADVSIHLDPSEVYALCDEKLEDDSRIDIDWWDDGSADLYFVLDEDTPKLSRKIYFQMPTDAVFDIDVTADDIEVVTTGVEDESDDEASPSEAKKENAASPSEISYEVNDENIASPSEAKASDDKVSTSSETMISEENSATPSEAKKEEDDETAATESEIGDSKHVKISQENGFIIRRETQALRVQGVRPEWKMNVKAKSSDNEDNTLDFALTASPKNSKSAKSLADKEQTLTLTVKVPKWLTICSGDVTWEQEEEQLLVDGTTIARIEGVPEEFVLINAEISDKQTIKATFERVQGEEEILHILDDEYEEEAVGPALISAYDDTDIDAVMLSSNDRDAAIVAGDDNSVDDGNTSDDETDIKSETYISSETDAENSDADITPVSELSNLKLSFSLYKSAPLFTVSDDIDLTYVDEDTSDTVMLSAVLTTISAGLEDTVSASATNQITLADYVDSVEEIIKVDKTTNITENIYWIDNNNSSEIRPGNDYLSKCEPNIYFTIDGGSEKYALNNTNWKKYFYPDDSDDAVTMPEPSYDGSKVTLSGLPTNTTKTNTDGTTETHEYTWTVELSNFDETTDSYTSKYSLVHVTDSNKSEYSTAPKNGWYYVEREDLNFNIDIKAGDKEIDANKLLSVIENKFNFNIDYDYDSGTVSKNFDEISGKQTVNYNKDNKVYNFAIKGVWKYNLDSTPLTYSLCKKSDSGTESRKITSSELDGAISGIADSDYLQIYYDNTDVANYSSITTKLYNGGTMDLQLKGSTSYSATKIWADTSDSSKRPTGTLELWRYIKGESYTDAAPIRNKDGEILTTNIGHNSDSNRETISFGGGSTTLDKYDPEGYEYVYVTREYLDATTATGENANAYEQVYGEIKTDSYGKEYVADKVEGIDITRDYRTERGNDSSTYTSGSTKPEAYVAKNDWLYNGGTLTNHLSDKIEVTGVKHWNSKAFQDDLKNVTVTMTLYSRKANDGTSEWTQVTSVSPIELTNFMNETVDNNSFSASVPRYDSEGNELIYRWIETSVAQTKDGTAVDTEFTTQAESSGSIISRILGTSGKITDSAQKATFSLSHIGETSKVLYESTSTYNATSGESYIENKVSDSVAFTLTKNWEEGVDKHEVSFALYRTTGSDDAEKLGTITLNGDNDSYTETTWAPDPSISDASNIIKETLTDDWKALLTKLPKYDAKGHLYQYYVTENGNTREKPTYETSRDEYGNWIANVTNSTGENNSIWIRKDWLDDGDSAHREPVTVGVYRNATSENDAANTKITEVKLSADNAWYASVGVGSETPNNLYIVEEKVGETNILTANNINKNQVTENNTRNLSYKTSYHEYKINYKKEAVDSESIFVVQNRRAGTLDYTVTKNWKDGDGSSRKALKEAIDAINNSNSGTQSGS